GDITAKVTFGAGTAVGDTVVVKDQTGTVVFQGPVTADMLANGQEVRSEEHTAELQSREKLACRDAPGNSNTATDAAALDVTAPMFAVEITADADLDCFPTRRSSDLGDITAKVTFGAGTAVGDTVVVKDQTGTVVFQGPVTADMLANGQEV